MNNLKRVALIITLAVGIFTAAPKKADAIVGLVTGNPALALAGLAVNSVSAIPMYVGEGSENKFMRLTGLLGSTIGLIMLDGEDGQKIAFESLSEEQASNLQLTKKEQKAYENNLEELSLISNIVSSKLNEESTLEDSQIVWERYEMLLPEDALSVARKIVSASVN